MSDEAFQPTNLSDLLSGQPSEAPAPAAPPPEAEAPVAAAPQPEASAETPQEAAERARVPKGEPGAGQFAAKVETGGADAASAIPADAAPQPEDKPGGSPPPEKVPQAALMGERTRRQQAEARAQFLEQQLQALTRLPQAPTDEAPQPKADFWDDPEAALEARFSQFGDQLFQRIEQRQVINHLNVSERAARGRYDDFDEVVGEFQRAVRENPSLAMEMRNAVDPAEYAYRKGKSLAEIHTYNGDIDALIAAKREEWESELRASAPSPTPTPLLPPSTATERSMGVPRSGPQWAGPKPLSELLR